MKGYLNDLAKVFTNLGGFRLIEAYKTKSLLGTCFRLNSLVFYTKDVGSEYSFQLLDGYVEVSKYCQVGVYGSLLDSDDDCLALVTVTLGPIRLGLSLCSVKYILDIRND
jgi:hypothetical protein